jgi:hypothetical protein
MQRNKESNDLKIKRSKKPVIQVKKTNTIKETIIATKDRVIRYLSSPYQGKNHDYRLLKEEFPCDENCFANFNIKVDLGYLGIAKDYSYKSICIPHKNTKRNPLTNEQKCSNKAMASERVIVEHSIGGMKRYRILSDRLRLHDFDFYNVILGVCAGLWNYFLLG